MLSVWSSLNLNKIAAMGCNYEHADSVYLMDSAVKWNRGIQKDRIKVPLHSSIMNNFKYGYK